MSDCLLHAHLLGEIMQALVVHRLGDCIALKEGIQSEFLLKIEFSLLLFGCKFLPLFLFHSNRLRKRISPFRNPYYHSFLTENPAYCTLIQTVICIAFICYNGIGRG